MIANVVMVGSGAACHGPLLRDVQRGTTSIWDTDTMPIRSRVVVKQRQHGDDGGPPEHRQTPPHEGEQGVPQHCFGAEQQRVQPDDRNPPWPMSARIRFVMNAATKPSAGPRRMPATTEKLI